MKVHELFSEEHMKEMSTYFETLDLSVTITPFCQYAHDHNLPGVSVHLEIWLECLYRYGLPEDLGEALGHGVAKDTHHDDVARALLDAGDILEK